MTPYSVLAKLLYWPICRAYARYLEDDPADIVMTRLSTLQFKAIHGFWPDLSLPRSFTEKLWSRMLVDRDPVLTTVSDKLRTREYVRAIAGADLLIPMLWSGTKAVDIPFRDLPNQFVIKATHGCGLNVVVTDKTLMDQPTVVRQLSKWLRVNFCEDTYLGIAWGYKHVPAAIIVESFIDDDGRVPVDYKFYCFSGRVEFLTVHYDRFENHTTRSFNRNFTPHEFRYGFAQQSGDCVPPPHFENMVQLAEALSKGFSFIRVDLYNVRGRIFFGEMTPYPGGVSTPFLPRELDYALGDKWHNGHAESRNIEQPCPQRSRANSRTR
jgi:hypothetical protein